MRLRAVLFAACAALAPSGLLAADLSASLAASAPLPCLQAMKGTVRTSLVHVLATAATAGAGKGVGAPAGWAPGNPHFDVARAAILRAMLADAEMTALLAKMDPEANLQIRFRDMDADEQAFLQSFFATPEGRLIWDALLDGAVCAGHLQSIPDAGSGLDAPGRALVATWRARTAELKQQLDEAEKTRFEQPAVRGQVQRALDLLVNGVKPQRQKWTAFGYGIDIDGLVQLLPQALVVAAPEVRASLQRFTQAAAQDQPGR